jgi:sarcosine oxidase
MGLIPELESLAVPERQVLAWFETLAPERFRPDTFPIFIVSVDEGMFYGFPIETIPGFKVGLYHHLREVVDPDAMDRQAHPRDEAPLRAFTEKYFPEGAGPTLSLKTCLFTNSPDEHFIVDVHPDLEQVVFAAGFSGHGFKFATVIGEVLADLSATGSTSHDISLLRYGRFADPGRRHMI